MFDAYWYLRKEHLEKYAEMIEDEDASDNDYDVVQDLEDRISEWENVQEDVDEYYDNE